MAQSQRTIAEMMIRREVPHRRSARVRTGHGPVRLIPYLVAIVAMTASCGGDKGDSFPRVLTKSGPQWIRLETTVLADPNGRQIGIPIGLAVGNRDGDYYVADRLFGTVWRFGRAGNFIQGYGGLRRGRASTRNVAGVAVVGDSVLLFDIGIARIQIFGRMTGRLLGSADLMGVPSLNLQGSGSKLRFGTHVDGGRGGLFVWDPTDGAAKRIGDVPSIFGRLPVLEHFNSIPIAQWGDSIVVGFGPLRALLVGSEAGGWTDTVYLPVSRRRGLAVQTLSDRQATRSELLNSSSFLGALHELSDGDILAIHYDYIVDEANPSTMPAKLYATVIDRDHRTACVDGKLPDELSTQPRVAFRGDTVVIVGKKLVKPGAVTVVSRWTLTMEDCEWVHLPSWTGMW